MLLNISNSRIRYQDYTQNGEAIFGQSDMGDHQDGILYVRKFV